MINMSDPRKKIKINMEINKKHEQNINTIHDKVMLQMLEDSANHNDEPLRLIEKVIFDPKTKTVEFDIKDSTVLKLMYKNVPIT